MRNIEIEKQEIEKKDSKHKEAWN